MKEDAKKIVQEGGKIYKMNDKVTFVAKYPSNYAAKKVKHLEDGKSYELHRLHAERLEKKGIGKIS